jgi:hypothetical protein
MDDIILGNDRAFWRSGMTCGYNAAPCGVVEQKASDNQVTKARPELKPAVG